CQPELDIFLGPVGYPGENVRSVAAAGLGGRLHHLGAHRGRGRIGAPQGREILRHRRKFVIPGQLADPQTDRGRGQESKRAISGRADDRGLDRRTGARGRAQGAGWPADAAKIRAAMENVKVDTQGLRGGPIEWSKDNHFRTRQYYRVYRWD